MSIRKTLDNLVNSVPVKNKAFVRTIAVTLSGMGLTAVGLPLLATTGLVGYSIYRYKKTNMKSENLWEAAVGTGAALLGVGFGPGGLLVAGLYATATYMLDADKINSGLNVSFNKPAHQEFVEGVKKTFKMKR